MTLNVIDVNAVDELYASLLSGENEKTGMHYLQCRFFQIAEKPNKEDILKIFGDSNINENTIFYLCNDGDVIIFWSNDFVTKGEQYIELILKSYRNNIKKYMDESDFFFHCYPFDNAGPIRTECIKKLKGQTRQGEELKKYFDNKALIDTISKTMQMIHMQRTFRVEPHILIVEDQVFSQKILTSILKDYTCYVADSSAEAFVQYMEKCPDIVLLDIELPDVDGHQFAEFLNKIDMHSYVVMATANNYKKDIEMAQQNKVKGFIAKPYEKETILKTIETYKKSKKRKAS